MKILTSIKTLWKMRWIFRSLPHTIYFNFHYLPFKQAVRLPILLYKPKLHQTKGRIIIQDKVSFGMIQLGKFSANINPNNGISFENLGGTIIFEGQCLIGNSSYLCIGPKACLTFGRCFVNASGLKLVCYKSITLGQHVRIGWNTILMDTNFHPLINCKDNTINEASGPIEIGNYNWFGLDCLVMHSVKTPPRCIFGARTTVSRNVEMESYSVTIPSSKGIIVKKMFTGILVGQMIWTKKYCRYYH